MNATDIAFNVLSFGALAALFLIIAKDRFPRLGKRSSVVPEPEPTAPPEIDWAIVRTMVVSLADVLGTYHTALLNAGFSEEEAFMLTAQYQATLVVSS